MAWPATRRPRPWATLTRAASSSSSISVVLASAPMWPQSRSPETFTLKMSTPSRANRRAARRNASGPSQMQAKRAASGIGKCAWSRSPRLPVGVISWLAANIRGPTIWPASIAFRTTTSSRGLAAAALTRLVNPWSSMRAALPIAAMRFSSTGIRTSSMRSATPVKEMWACPSTSPGITVRPSSSMRNAWSGGLHDPPAATTASMRLPTTRRRLGTAPNRSHRRSNRLQDGSDIRRRSASDGDSTRLETARVTEKLNDET